jgi:hypothetical protein
MNVPPDFLGFAGTIVQCGASCVTGERFYLQKMK